MPDWVEHAIWWHVYPLGALGADLTGADRGCRRPISELVAWLDHAVSLGCNGLALGPIARSVSHGYDTLDLCALDERLGSLDDFRTLVREAHARGIRVMLDGVFNHVSREHELVRDPRRAVSEGWALDAGHGYLHGFEGHNDLITLNHDSDCVRRMVIDAMNFWLDLGVDAWRLDAAYAVPPAFWAGVLPEVRAAHPDVYVMGEVIHGDYVDIVQTSGMDAVTQYELWKAIWSSITDANMHELAWTLQRHDEFLRSFVPYTFVGNHDVTRIATRLEGRPSHLAVVLLATLPGTPAVYYGDEWGWQGLKQDRPGGDDAVRTTLPAVPGPDAGAGDPEPEVLRLHRELFGIRRRFPGVHAAPVETLHVDGGALVYRCGGATPIVVALNSGDSPVEVGFPASGTLASQGSRREGDTAWIDRGGWIIAAG